MPTACPRCGYERRPSDTAPAYECPSCAVVYSKFQGHAPVATAEAEPWPAREVSWVEEDEQSLAHGVASALVAVPERVDRPTIWGHTVVLIVMLLWAARFPFYDVDGAEAMGSFLHLIDLVFHEAGHILFIPFGTFMTILGGSLLQLLVPLVLACAFAFKYRNAFGAAVCTWWLGQSLVDLAPYIYDAREQKLMLLGGFTGKEMPGVHDWGNILNSLEIIRYDHEIGRGAQILGCAVMFGACAWAGYLLSLERRNATGRIVEFDE